jgi:3-deoxy-7-phosphoheptulonate synthase
MESFDQMDQVCSLATELGISYIRAQAFKPRTSPTSFQGLGIEGIQIIQTLKEKYPHLNFVSEVCSCSQFDQIANVTDIIQIGARNMQNFELLKYISNNLKKDKKVILKRGFANTSFEWLEASKYLEADQVSKDQIILCERGSRSITSSTGVNIDFISALEAKSRGHKVIIDPSHGTKKDTFVLPLATAAIAMDFDGIMIEVHPNPKNSVSDKDQALGFESIRSFIHGLDLT